MIEYVYEVRGTNDPIDGDHVRFTTKAEAVEYKNSVVDKYPEASVYMISYEFDDEDGNDGVFSIPKKLHEIQVSGPDVDANLADPTVPNSCEGDACDFRLPKEDDGLDTDLVDIDAISVEEGLFDDFKFDPVPYVEEIWEFANEEPADGIYKLVKTREYKYDPEVDGPHNTISGKSERSFRQRPNAAFVVSRNLKTNKVSVIQWSPKIEGKTLDPIGMSAEDQEAITNQFKNMYDDDDIETESFAEELFSEVAKMKESKPLEETVETNSLEKELEQTKQEYEEVAADKDTPKNKAKEQELVMKMADLKNKIALDAVHKEN